VINATQKKARSRCARRRACRKSWSAFITYFAAPDTAANTLCAW
jgi:hypothetical protein